MEAQIKDFGLGLRSPALGGANGDMGAIARALTPAEIKAGEILVKDNVFEHACELTSDCGGLKFWGDPPDGHVYRDVLITGNIFRTGGWFQAAPIVVNSRNGWRLNCGEDAGYPFGSSLDNSDGGTGNVVAPNTVE